MSYAITCRHGFKRCPGNSCSLASDATPARAPVDGRVAGSLATRFSCQVPTDSHAGLYRRVYAQGARGRESYRAFRLEGCPTARVDRFYLRNTADVGYVGATHFQPVRHVQARGPARSQARACTPACPCGAVTPGLCMASSNAGLAYTILEMCSAYASVGQQVDPRIFLQT